MRVSKKEQLLCILRAERRARLKPLEKDLDISGIKSYLRLLQDIAAKQDNKVCINIIQREIDAQTEKLAILEKSMRQVGIYLADIGRWLHLEGFAKEEDMDLYISELKKYSAILIGHALIRKKTAHDD